VTSHRSSRSDRNCAIARKIRDMRRVMHDCG
jgi:hypothetical protein